MLGIDVSKKSLSVCRWEGTAQGNWELPNSPQGVQQLLALSLPQEPWALEPTGRYSDLVVQTGTSHGRKVLLAPPRAAKQFLASVNPRAKTDRLDARGLAQYAASVPLKAFRLKNDAMERLSQLLSCRTLLVTSRAALNQQAAALVQVRSVLEPAITTLNKQIKELDREIAQLAKDQPAVARLQAVPGIGPVAAAALVVRLQSSEFTTYDQFVAYVGLDLRVSDSGSHRGRRMVSHYGDAELRRLLYLCAQASVRTKGSPFTMQYERELAKGMAKTQALCAVARKLARLSWALVHSGAAYDANRVYNHPSRT